MTKPTISRVFVASVVAVIAGLLLAFVTLLVAFGNGAFVMRGPDVVGVHWDAFTATTLGLGIVGILAMIAGCIGGLVAWIGALLNTAQLDDKTWFIVLLVLGLFSFGLVAMIAYVIAGPDALDRPRGATGAVSPI